MDVWLYPEWKTEAGVDSLLQATLPPNPAEDEVDTCEALVLASRLSELSNVATPESDAVLVTRSKVAEPSDAGICEEEDIAIRVTIARMVTRHTPVDDTKPLVVEDRLTDKDILAWLHDKLYHNDVNEPRAWTAAVTYIVSRLNIMSKYEDGKGTSHTTVGLASRHCHIFVVNGDDREGLHCFVCAMECRVLVWACKVHI